MAENTVTNWFGNIVSHPAVIVDANSVDDIVKVLKSQKRLIFMSSHLLPEVMDVCDEIAMIDHGKLLVYDALQCDEQVL